MRTQNHYINSLKSDCNFCHQLGNAETRDVDHIFKAKPELKTHAEAWEWRLGTGVRGTSMYSVLQTQGKDRLLKTYADWTERIAKGDVPPAPQRPKGVERNLVVTLWDVGDDHSFMHDEISTDKNHPNVNAGGNVYAVSGDTASSWYSIRTNKTFSLDIPTGSRRESPVLPVPTRPSRLGQRASVGQPAHDPPIRTTDDRQQGPRVDDVKIRSNQDPEWCKATTNKFAEWFARAVAVRRPLRSEDEAVHADRHCYSTHHLQFDNDADETVLQRARRPDLRTDRYVGLRPDEGRAEERLVRPGARPNGDGDYAAWTSRVSATRRCISATPRRRTRGRGADVRWFNPARHDGHLQPTR